MATNRGKLIAIGGGEISLGETRAIDMRIISLSNKKRPSVLFIPTASRDSESYCANFSKEYLGLGCKKVDFLLLYSLDKKLSRIKKKIKSADIIYVGGGNTLRMLGIWKKRGVDRLLKASFFSSGKVFCGLSAGAICWFSFGTSDSRKFWKRNPSSRPMRVSGLGVVPGKIGFSPHHFRERKWRNRAVLRLAKPGEFVFAADDCSAVETVDGGHTWSSISTKKGRFVRVLWPLKG